MVLSQYCILAELTPQADLTNARLLDLRQMGVILCGVGQDIACDVTAKLAFLQD